MSGGLPKLGSRLWSAGVGWVRSWVSRRGWFGACFGLLEDGPAFEIEDDGITTLLETGDPATFDATPQKKRRLPAHTLPTGKECEMIVGIFEQCVEAQRERCSKTFDIAINLSSAARGNYYSITGLNRKFDVNAFETACQAVCRKGGKALTEKAITTKFCG